MVSSSHKRAKCYLILKPTNIYLSWKGEECMILERIVLRRFLDEQLLMLNWWCIDDAFRKIIIITIFRWKKTLYISGNIWYIECLFPWGNYGNPALCNACELVKCIIHWRSPFENLWSAEVRSFEKVAKRAEVRSSSGNWQPIDKVVHPTSLPACLLFLHGFLMCIYLCILGPKPALGWLGQDGSLWGYSSHGYASHASLLAARREQEVQIGLRCKTVTNGVPRGHTTDASISHARTYPVIINCLWLPMQRGEKCLVRWI